MVGVCNGTAKGGYLSRLITELATRAGENRPVIVRSTAFPASSNAAVSKQIGELITRGGRRVVVEDSDWRTMAAFRQFRKSHHEDPAFGAWLRGRATVEPPEGPPCDSRPRSPQRCSVIEGRGSPGSSSQARETGRGCPEENRPPSPARTRRSPLIALGSTNDRAKGPVTLEADSEPTRHAAFLGGTGSGKTTVALNLVDAPGGGSPRPWSTARGSVQLRHAKPPGRACSMISRLARAAAATPRPGRGWRRSTPGNPNGRPLSSRSPRPQGPRAEVEVLRHERAVEPSAQGRAPAWMMNHGPRGPDPARHGDFAA